jgi:NHLM bacteriocin system ABC transporter ATP-binding protein
MIAAESMRGFEGQQEQLRGNNPLLLAGTDAVWVVQQGQAHVFVVELEGDTPVGPRWRLFTAEAGELLLGVPSADAAGKLGLLAVGEPDTRLLRVEREQLVKMVRDRQVGAGAIALIEKWIQRTTEGLLHASGPRDYVLLESGREAELPEGAIGRSHGEMVWVDVDSQELQFLGELAAPDGLLPLTDTAWVKAGRAVRLEPVSSAQVLQAPDGWDSLGRFGQFVLSCARVRLDQIRQAERRRLEDKGGHDQLALDRAYNDLAAALVPARQREVTAELGVEPLMAACQLIGKAQGMAFTAPPPPPPGQRPRDEVEAIARASRVRHRAVALKGDWWRGDQGPVLGFLGADARPVALLPRTWRSYDLADPTAGTRVRLTAELAAQVQPYGCAFYRPFPERALTAGDLLRFGAKGIWPDVLRMFIAGMAGGLLAMLTPILTGTLFGHIIPAANHAGVLAVAVALIVSALASSVFSVVRGIARVRLETRMDMSLHTALMDRLFNLPAYFFRNYTAGDLGSRAIGIAAIRAIITGPVATAVFTAIFSVFSFGLLFYYSIRLALVATGLLALTMVVTLALGRLQLKYQRPLVHLQNQLSGLTFQFLNGIAKLRIAAGETRAFARWARDQGRANELTRANQQLTMGLNVLYGATPLLSLIAIFAMVAAASDESLTTAAFLAFIIAYGQVSLAVLGLAPAVSALLQIIPIFDTSRPILEAMPEVDVAKEDPPDLVGHIDVRHVNFRYVPDGPLVLDDLSFEAKPGQFVAFVGPSGSGKSTVFRLLLGFETPESGSVHYDGQDLSRLDLRGIRKQLGVVLQNGRLMPGTIYDNIVGSANLTVDDAWEAARMAGFDEDIKGFPMGMDTYLTEGSGVISGGQRQRLMIARAIVGRPRILLFDEATSALDNKTQAIVSHSLEQLKATRIVIAHRLSTVMKADVIFVIVDGRVVQQGTAAQLMDQPGPFQELSRRQLS